MNGVNLLVQLLEDSGESADHVEISLHSATRSLRRLTLRHHHRTMSTSWVALAVAR